MPASATEIAVVTPTQDGPVECGSMFGGGCAPYSAPSSVPNVASGDLGMDFAELPVIAPLGPFTLDLTSGVRS